MAQAGPQARIIGASRVRKGGLAGFFAREHIEVEVEVAPGQVSPGRPANGPRHARSPRHAQANYAPPAQGEQPAAVGTQPGGQTQGQRPPGATGVTGAPRAPGAPGTQAQGGPGAQSALRTGAPAGPRPQAPSAPNRGATPNEARPPQFTQGRPQPGQAGPPQPGQQRLGQPQRGQPQPGQQRMAQPQPGRPAPSQPTAATRPTPAPAQASPLRQGPVPSQAPSSRPAPETGRAPLGSRPGPVAAAASSPAPRPAPIPAPPRNQEDPLTSLIEEMAGSGPSSVLDLAEQVNDEEGHFGLPMTAGEDGAHQGAPPDFASVLARIAVDSGLVPGDAYDVGTGPNGKGRNGSTAHHAELILGEFDPTLEIVTGEDALAASTAATPSPLTSERHSLRAHSGPVPPSLSVPAGDPALPGQELARAQEQERARDAAIARELAFARELTRAQMATAPTTPADHDPALATTGTTGAPGTAQVPGAARAPLPASRRVSNVGLALHQLGLPLEACRAVQPAPTRESLQNELARALRLRLPVVPHPPKAASSVVAVIGPKAEVMSAAWALAEEMGTPPDDVALATRRELWRHQDHVIASPESALERRRSWRWRSAPSVVAIEHEVRPGPADWAAEMLKALSPTLCWGVASAAHKPEDIAAWSQSLGGLDAIALVDLESTTTPAAALCSPVPVGRLDGAPATPELWAKVLCDRLLT